MDKIFFSFAVFFVFFFSKSFAVTFYPDYSRLPISKSHNHKKVAIVAFNFVEISPVERILLYKVNLMLKKILLKGYDGYFLYRNMTSSPKKEQKKLKNFLSKISSFGVRHISYDLIHFGHGGEGASFFHKAVAVASSQLIKEKKLDTIKAKIFFNLGCQDGRKQEYSYKWWNTPSHPFKDHRPLAVIDNTEDTMGLKTSFYFLKSYLSDKWSVGQAVTLANNEERKSWIKKIHNSSNTFFKKIRIPILKNRKNLSVGNFQCSGRCYWKFSTFHSYKRK